MKPRVYIETSVVSYLTARLSRDVMVLSNQLATRAWWVNAEERYSLVTSELVIWEARQGHPEAASRRIDALDHVPLLEVSDAADTLSRKLVSQHAMPSTALHDATHVSLAVVNGVEFLATWNSRHIANPMTILRINAVCRDAGYEPVIVCTPSQLMETTHEKPIQ